jgi:VWFA-related protein
MLVVSLLLTTATGSRGAGVPQSSQDEGIRIGLPSNGKLRVENQFGDVNILIGSERDVVITSRVERGNNQRGRTFDNSPVVIETKQNALLISVVRASGDSTARIDLTLRIPATTNAEIVTGEGMIVSHGLSSSMTLNTTAGRIRAEIEKPLDADIQARSISGTVTSQIGLEEIKGVHNYSSRFGQGHRVLRAGSKRGEITLSFAEPERPRIEAAPRVDSPPQLRKEDNAAGAGIPESQSATEEVGEDDIIRVDAQLVTLNLSVIDRGTNRGVVGLNQSNFKLFEAGVEQRILRFESSSAPFDLILLIDLSGSTREVVNLIRAAARRFVDAARPSDRIAIITFAGRPTVVSPLTLDRETLRQGVNAIDTLPGDTKLYDATDFAMAEVARETKNSRRTAIVLMTDGLDGTVPGVQGDGSELPYKELLNTVREFDGVVYTLWLNTYYEAMNPKDTQPEAFETGHDRMKEMADVGGGVFYEVERLTDLAGAYERVVADLGTVYSLAYRPLNKTRDRKWRGINVVVDRKDAVARGKHGYYAN